MENSVSEDSKEMKKKQLIMELKKKHETAKDEETKKKIEEKIKEIQKK